MCVAAIGGAEMAMRDAGIPVEEGRGVAAAQSWYRESKDKTVEQLRAVA